MTRAEPPAAPPAAAPLAKSLQANPLLSQWVGLDPDGTVHVRTGKAELGQGVLTALARIAATELQVHPGRVRVHAPTTVAGPDEGLTSGSMSVAESGTALRAVCAELRALLLAAAAARCGIHQDELGVSDGAVHDASGRVVTTYGELAAQVDLDRPGTGTVPPCPVTEAGPEVPRLDLPDKVFGRPRFVHDLALPGLLHGRVVRPVGPGARLASLGHLELPAGATVVRAGSFLGVVAATEPAARRAAARLAAAASWVGGAPLPDDGDVVAWLRRQPAETTVLVGQAVAADEPTAVGRSFRASYSRPFVAHASIGPSCAVARWVADALEVWSHTQGVHPLRRALAAALDVPAGQVSVHHAEGAGCYGHNGADDVALDAALLSRAVQGRPVRVQWSRADELAWSPLGSAMVADVAVTTSEDGSVLRWSYDVRSSGFTSRPGYGGSPGLIAAAHAADEPLPAALDPPAARGHGAGRNAVPLYPFPGQRVAVHRLTTMPVRTSALRSLGAHLNVFAIESAVDELARAAGRDPLAFRLAYLGADQRARDVLLAAADAARWDRPLAGDAGRGIAVARYKGRGACCAVVAEVEAVAEVRLRKLVAAVDVGRVVDLDGVRNQVEGGMVQAASWTTRERVRFGAGRVTSDSWEGYPVLRFCELPDVEVVVVDRPEEPSVGAGECAAGPTAAAIANAVHDAIGVRVRDLPLTAERVVAAMD